MEEEPKKKQFEVMSVGELRKKYYPPNEAPPAIRLDPQNVPAALRSLIPLAEQWGISDDILRGDAVQKASPECIEELKRIVNQHDDLFDAWLAGPEAQSSNPTKEYLAFTHLRMAADGC